MDFIKAEINNPFVQSMMENNLKPIKVYYAGDYEREHVVIEVCHNCYLSDYALIQITRNEEDFPEYSKCRFLTFDEIDLYEGDRIKVMTCRGIDKSIRDKDGHTTHVIHWNLPSSVWKDGENEVMIMERGDSITCYLKNSSSKEN